MRVTSSLWVSALVRRANGADSPAVIVRRGAEEAGAIFILIDRLDGTLDLYVPAPQTEFDEEKPTDRKFQLVAPRATDADVKARMDKEMRFDPDVWIVAIENRDGRTFFDVM